MGTIDAGLGRRQLQPAHVEVVLPALERLDGKHPVHEPFGIGAKLRHLRGRVAFADEQDVDLLRGRTVLEQRPDVAGFRRIRAVDESRVGIDDRGPQLVKAVVAIALLQNDLDRRLRPRESQRFAERAVQRLVLSGRLPFAVDGREAARVDRTVGVAIDHLEQVFAEIEIVNETRPASRPRTIRDHTVERHDLLSHSARVEIVQAHRAAGEPGVEGYARLRRGNRRAGQQRTRQSCEEKSGSDAADALHPGILAGPGRLGAPSRDRNQRNTGRRSDDPQDRWQRDRVFVFARHFNRSDVHCLLSMRDGDRRPD